MPPAKISVKRDTKRPGNILEVSDDGVYVPKPPSSYVLYSGLMAANGNGRVPDGWQLAPHWPKMGYALFPHPDLTQEGYEVVCNPRSDPAKDFDQLTKDDLAPLTIFIHKLEPGRVRISVANAKGEQVDHAFTWMMFGPQ